MNEEYLYHGAAAVHKYQTTAMNSQSESFVTPLESAHLLLNEVLLNLQGVTDRLVGSQPEPQADGNTSKLTAVSASVFDNIAERGRDMHVKLDQCNSLIQRIQRSLP